MIKFLQDLFGSSPVQQESLGAIGVDMHSHVLPGLDDGADSPERSLELITALKAMGYRKLIMTPHVMSDFYRNTPEGIRARLQLLQEAILEAGIEMELGCAAEYYLDEGLLDKLEKGEELLTFGDNYLLFETSFLNEPMNLREAIFQMQANGYQPVLAHPERYTYFYGKYEELAGLHDLGVLFQLNLNSLTGYYSPGAREVAERLIDEGLVDFLGSDTHSLRHIESLKKVLYSKHLTKALALPIRNSQL
ncbi:tyrosine-protein phosphatase [Pontibacter liquoris]|uniref:tyrosine-protein phosphatase n=1 Tax=Pontibacter liquoris TaxID=2905677 RepID=UPI001FA76A3C|nr:CpsB/CapC family capsule biosynthesis tyrosine phosphatase [Pontibacter liquoris]